MVIRDSRRVFKSGGRNHRLDLLRSKAADDTPRFIRKNLRIIAGREAGKPQLVNLVPSWSQEQLLNVIHMQEKASKPVRVVVVKSRQVGLSTISSGYTFTKTWAEDNTHALVMANTDLVAINLFEMYKRFHQYLPPELQLPMQRSNKRELLFDEMYGSKLQIITAGSPESARSRTPRRVQLSEYGFYKNAGDIIGALEAGIPNVTGTSILIESTAYGAGTDFHSLWQNCESGDTHYYPLFLEWFKDPKCQLPPFPNQKVEDLYVAKMFDKYPQLKDRMEHFRLTTRQIGYYYELLHNDYKGDFVLLCTEYPMTVQEAFRATGSPVFPIDLLDCYKDKQRPAKRYDPTNPWTALEDLSENKYLRPNTDIYLDIWIKPIVGREYLIVCDPAAGLQFSDYSCALIFDIATCTVVGELHGRIEIKPFAQMVKKLGHLYNSAVIMPEVDGLGAALLEELKEDYFHIYYQRKDEGYGEKMTNKLGWETNQKSKHLAASLTRTMLNENKESASFLPCIHLYEELSNLTQDDLEKNTRAVTDRAMAYMIGLQGCVHELKSRPEIAQLTRKSSRIDAETEPDWSADDTRRMIKSKGYVHGQPYEPIDPYSAPFVPDKEGIYNLGDDE